jgi:opacity protein-like surface antigen
MFGESLIGMNLNAGAAYPDGQVTKDYSRSYAPSFGAGFSYEYSLNDRFSALSGLNYEYRPIAFKYHFPKKKNGKLTIRQYFVGLDAIARAKFENWFIDAGCFFSVKGGPGRYVYTGDYSEEGSVRDFDEDAKETFPFGLILGAGRIFAVTERTVLDIGIRYKYELTSQYENPDSSWKIRVETICLNAGMRYRL